MTKHIQNCRHLSRVDLFQYFYQQDFFLYSILELAYSQITVEVGNIRLVWKILAQNPIYML